MVWCYIGGPVGILVLRIGLCRHHCWEIWPCLRVCDLFEAGCVHRSEHLSSVRHQCSTRTSVSRPGLVSSVTVIDRPVDFNGKNNKNEYGATGLILAAIHQITKLTICSLTFDISKNKHTNNFTCYIPSNLRHMPSGYESNWHNMLTSQSTLAALLCCTELHIILILYSESTTLITYCTCVVFWFIQQSVHIASYNKTITHLKLIHPRHCPRQNLS